MKKIFALFLIVSILLLLLTGCMPGDGSYVEGHYANFLSGIWHGWIATISIIRGLFNPSIRVYEAYNTGW